MFGSLAGAPSEKYGEDGSLSMMLNLVREDEALRPVMPGTTLMTYPKNMEMLYLHKYNTEKNYVFRRRETDGCQSVVYVEKDDLPQGHVLLDEAKVKVIHTFEPGEEVKSVTSVGYVLVINTSTGLHYAMMREDEAHGRKFEYMGMLPDLPRVEPRLYVSMKAYDDIVDKEDRGEGATSTAVVSGFNATALKNLCDASNDKATLHMDSGMRAKVGDVVFSMINTLRTYIHKNGCFFSPFLVRFGFRMFDGRTLSLTQPIALCPNDSYNPLVMVTGHNNTTATFSAAMPSGELYVRCSGMDPLWRELITGVDVYVTREVVGYSDDNNAVSYLEKAYKDDESYQSDKLSASAYCHEDQDEEGEVRNVLLKKNLYEDLTANRRYYTSSGRWKKRTKFSMHYEQKVDGIKIRNYYLIRRADTDNPNHLISSLDGVYRMPMSTDEAKKWATEYNIQFDVDDFYVYVAEIAVYWYECTENVSYIKVSCLKDGGLTIKASAFVNLERTDGVSANEAFIQQAEYFLLDTIDFEAAGEGEFDINVSSRIDKHKIENITSSDQLGAELVDGFRFTCGTLKPTNNRLVVDVREQEFPATYIIRDSPGTTAEEGYTPVTTMDGGVWVKVVENGMVYFVPVNIPDGFGLDNIRYYYYPFRGAEELIIAGGLFDCRIFQMIEGLRCIYSIPLKKHPTMVGSYSFNNFDEIMANEIMSEEDDYGVFTRFTREVARMNSSPKSRYVGNKIYQSEVNNPFAFLNRTTSTLNCSKIMAIETLSTPLSTGQFGDFQLVAFTDNGLWAVKTDETGAIMGAKDVISDDVLLNGTSVSNVDGSLIYATNRGIMQLVGSKAECISDHLRIVGKKDVKPSQLGGIAYCVEAKDVRDFVAEEGFCVLRDNRNQQLIFLNKHDEWCYVYSMIGDSWGVMERGGLEKSINSYPECWVEASNGGYRSIVKMDERQTGYRDVFLLTRAIKSSEAGVLKTLRKLIMRGEFTGGAIRMGVWGSNDARKWVLIASSSSEYLRAISGTPMKYMKVAAWGTVEDYDCLSGMSMELEPRRGENGAE